MNCTNRDCSAADFPQIAAIYGHHVLHGIASFEEVPPSVEDLMGRRDDVIAAGLPYLIAEADIVGYAYASPYRSRSAYRYTIEDSVYVDHRLGGRGIGRALLSTLVARCDASDWRQLIAVIGEGDNTASIVLHERCGFVHSGMLRAVGFKFGRWIDTVFMQRALGGGERMSPETAAR